MWHTSQSPLSPSPKNFEDRGSRIKDQGSRIKDQGSRIKDQGSGIKDQTSYTSTRRQVHQQESTPWYFNLYQLIWIWNLYRPIRIWVFNAQGSRRKSTTWIWELGRTKLILCSMKLVDLYNSIWGKALIQDGGSRQVEVQALGGNWTTSCGTSGTTSRISAAIIDTFVI